MLTRDSEKGWFIYAGQIISFSATEYLSVAEYNSTRVGVVVVVVVVVISTFLQWDNLRTL